MALSHAWVSAIVSSSRSMRLRPSWLPSVDATRFTTGMKAGDAGIFSSARFRLATTYLFLAAAVGGLLDPAPRSRLELLAPALGRGDSVLDRLADGGLRVADHGAGPLRRVTGTP